MTCICIESEEFVIFARGEKLMAHAVDCEPYRTGARCELPRCCDRFCGCVNANDFTECRKGHEDTAFAIAYGRAGTSAERNGRDDLVGCGVDDGRTTST